MTSKPLLSTLSHIPPEVLCAQDYEVMAESFIDPATFAYIAGGSGADITASRNLTWPSQWALQSRVLRDVHEGHTQAPIFLAPVAYQALAHINGEIETAHAAKAMQVPMILSTLSTVSLEKIAEIGVPRWFQLYLQPNWANTLDLIQRATNAGYEKIVLTLDATIQVPSHRAIRAGFVMPESIQAVNLMNYDVNSRIVKAPVLSDLVRVIEASPVPVWVKGILHSDDAKAAIQAGAEGVIVSNHGGRTMDGVVSPWQVLESIRSALGSDVPILMDGGIRSGQDVFKAMALGANGVLIGRLQVYASAVAGALGVAHMLKLLQEEFEIAMAVCGCASVAEIKRDCLC